MRALRCDHGRGGEVPESADVLVELSRAEREVALALCKGLTDKEVADKLILSCHIGGITNSSFVRGFAMMWDDIAKVEKGERPGNIVNKL